MDSIIDGIITNPEIQSQKRQDFSNQNSESPGNMIWSEDSDDFSTLINTVINNNYLDDPTDKHQDIINAVIGYMKNSPDLDRLYSSIQSGLECLPPNWRPQPLTMGAFFFGAYLSGDKYSTSNKYCDPLAAFAIPNFKDRNQVCESNVIYFRSKDMAVELNNNKTVCMVHLNSDHPSSLNTDQVAKLKSFGCAKMVVYKAGEKMIETTFPEVTQPIEFVPKLQFPSVQSSTQSENGIIVVPSNVTQLNKNIEQELITKRAPPSPTQEYPGVTVIAIILLLFIYLWVGQRALR